MLGTGFADVGVIEGVTGLAGHTVCAVLAEFAAGVTSYTGPIVLVVAQLALNAVCGVHTDIAPL